MSLFDEIDNGILLIDEDLTILSANTWFETHLQKSRTEIVGQTLHELFGKFNETLLNRRIKTSLLLGEKTYLHYHATGAFFPIPATALFSSLSPLMQQNITIIPEMKEKKSVYLIITDKTQEATTEKKEKNQLIKIKELNEKLGEYVTVIDHYVMTITTDSLGVITDISQAMCAMNGYIKEELIGKKPNVFRHPDTPSSFYTALWNSLLQEGCWEGEVCNKKKNGEDYWVYSHISTHISEKNEPSFTAILQDITDKKRVEYLLIIDSLTKVYNRQKFTQTIDEWLATNCLFTFVIVDIDNFKGVNDTFGHAIGDDVLITLATCIKEIIPHDTIFARWGGEEFVLLIPGEKALAYCLVEKIQYKLTETTFPHNHPVTLSIGLAEHFSSESKEDLFERADSALYTAKRTGKNKIVEAV